MSYTCGTGAWSGPLPGDPSTNSILTATPVFGGIDVTWTPAIVNPHAVAHTYLYRSTNPDFLTAVPIATVGGTHFYDKLENLLTYYYWIQVVSINGTLGEVIGPASAIPRLSIDATIEALTGRIDNGVLAQSLKSEIDRISLIDGDLFQEIQDRIAANELLGAAIQVAQTDASQAVSLLNEEITQRTTTYNVLLQTLNTMAGQVNDNKAAIETESTLRISNDEALAQQITNVQSAAGDNLAAVQTTLQTNIDTVDGKVTDIGALYTAKVQVNGLIGGFGVYNDGTEVQAGFDVDTFWVGRTGPDKKKPFIIDSATGETYIDKAVIPTLTADMIDTRGLSIKDTNGNIILAAGTALDWSRIGGTGKTTVETNASTALANATAAQTAANNANNTLADIASDSKLTPVEKQSAANEWGIINRERASIQAQASALGIVNELGDYNYTYAVLNDYITPLLQDISSTSVIDGATFRDKWSYFYEYRQRLMNKMSAVAATRADWASVQSRPSDADILNAGSNLILNPDLRNSPQGDGTTAKGWSFNANSGAFYYRGVLQDSANGPPFDSSQPMFYTNSTGADGQVSWITSDYIPVGLDRNYTVSAWLRCYSGNPSAYLGVVAYDGAYASFGYVYPAGLFSLNSTTLSASWEHRYGVYGPGHTALPAGTKYVRVVWWGTYLSIGATLATRFCFNEGVVPSRSVVPLDSSLINKTNPITASNVTTYIENAAIGAAQIGSIELVGESAFRVRTNNSAGARMDMDSRRIKIFDESGQLRVQLGDLTA